MVSGQRVLLVGSSFSVEDFACLLTKAGAAQIDVSSRRPQMIITLPASVTKHPLPTKIEGSSVTLVSDLKNQITNLFLFSARNVKREDSIFFI